MTGFQVPLASFRFDTVVGVGQGVELVRKVLIISSISLKKKKKLKKQCLLVLRLETLIQKVQGPHSLDSSGYLTLLKVKLSELSQKGEREH